jgi:hypothetical protein
MLHRGAQAEKYLGGLMSNRRNQIGQVKWPRDSTLVTPIELTGALFWDRRRPRLHSSPLTRPSVGEAGEDAFSEEPAS